MLNDNLYREIVKQSPYGYFYCNLKRDVNNDIVDLLILDWNSSFKEMIKCKEENISGKTMTDILPDFFHEISDWYLLFEDARLLKKGSTKELYIKCLAEWFSIHILNYDEDYFAVTLMKINKEKEFMKALTDSLPFAAWAKDVKGRYIAVNKKYEKDIGLLLEEIKYKNDFEIWPSSLAKQYIEEDYEVISKGAIKHITNFYLNGVWYETYKVPFYDESGNITGTIGFSIDITQRINAETKLRESEEKFRQLVENIDGMFLIREDEQIIYASPGYEQIFRRSCEELYKSPRSFLDAVHPEDRNKFLGYSNDSFRENTFDNAYLKINFNEYLEETFRVIRPDETIRWVWMKSFPITDKRGKVIRRLSIGHDITAIKEAEAELERIRTEFFANLSHEFRTPLNLIFSSLQMMEIKLRDNAYRNIDSVVRYMNIIKQNSFRLLRLTNNLIDTTEMDAGYFEYFPENQDIVAYIKKIVDSVNKFLSDRDIKLTFNTELEEKTIAFDIDKMERIILNLLSNAIKFNKPGGKIEVSVSMNDKFVEIHITDTGIGIPEDKLQDIFQRFKQVHNRLTKVSEGSAIGLSLVKSLVEIHKGTINVKSSLDEGTEFIVSFPDILVDDDKIMFLSKNHIASNSRIERVQMELSDIYGLNLS